MPAALRALLGILCAFFLFGGVTLLFPAPSASADTTPFRSASLITTDGSTLYTNLQNCSATDGLTCDRVSRSGFGNLYFRDFGNFADFGMPEGSTITGVTVKITGKSSHGYYPGLSAGVTYNANCQSPPDLWATFPIQTITTHTFSAPVDVPRPGAVNKSCLTEERLEANNFIWRINYSSGQSWSVNIDNFEIALDYDPPPDTSPQPPEPFLDLPWSYETSGKSFEDAALNPSSWFDHQYPLQNVPCCEPFILDYTGQQVNKSYRSHSGYDYAAQNGVFLNTPVLAAASGWATYVPESRSGGGGTVVKVDHGNGYQTWYQHLSNEDLIVSGVGERVYVNKGQQIGKVGMTGNITGPHIHLSVFKDANGNGSFDDDYPYGLVDPLGWEGEGDDPWTERESNGRRGEKSYNLFIPRAQPAMAQIPTTGGNLEEENAAISVPDGAWNTVFNLIFRSGPFESASENIKSIAPSFFLNAVSNVNQQVTQFLKPIGITYDYSGADLLNSKEETLKLYHFNEQTSEWEALPSTVDMVNKTVSAETLNFSQFALMGEVKDLVAPTTQVLIQGDKGEENFYRSSVSVELNGIDNADGIGLLYTLYSFNESDWFEYTGPLSFENEGTYTIYYQSFDRADNKEARKSLTFSIDKTPPEAEIMYYLDDRSIRIEGKDGSDSASITQSGTGMEKKFILKDKAGNTLTLLSRMLNSRLISWMSIQSLQYNTDFPLSPEKNTFLITPIYYWRTRELQSVGQAYAVKEKNVIGAVYNLSTGNTRIYSYDRNDGQLLKEILEGERLLQLYTEKGTLKYRY